MSHRLLVKDAHGERELLLIDTIVVGRDPRCDISGSDAQLSRRHAEFSISDRGVVVRDLNSRNGMLVNGRRVLEALLHPGDVVQVGNIAVTFLRASAEPVAVSMPTGFVPRTGGAGKARQADDSQPVLPFRAHHEDDERTRHMSLDDVAAAAIASLSDRPKPAVEAERPSAEASSAGTVAAAAGNWSAPTVDGAWPPVPAAAPSRPSDNRPAAGPSAAEPPALAEQAARPITGLAEPAWAASVTWHIGTLAIVAFLFGAVSVLPGAAIVARGGVVGALLMLVVPLVALLAALGLGLYAAARVRRTVSHAINAALERERRP